VLHKQLGVFAYTVELRREIKDAFPLKRFECAHLVLSEAVKVCDFLRRVLSTDETSCHITGCINGHNSTSRMLHLQIQLHMQLAHIVRRLRWG
jgi:hypothetical protein